MFNRRTSCNYRDNTAHIARSGSRSPQRHGIFATVDQHMIRTTGHDTGHMAGRSGCRTRDLQISYFRQMLRIHASNMAEKSMSAGYTVNALRSGRSDGKSRDIVSIAIVYPGKPARSGTDPHPVRILRKRNIRRLEEIKSGIIRSLVDRSSQPHQMGRLGNPNRPLGGFSTERFKIAYQCSISVQTLSSPIVKRPPR